MTAVWSLGTWQRRSDAEELQRLIHHWGDAYLITRTADGRWRAIDPDNDVVLRARTAAGLRRVLRHHYLRTVPR